MINGAIKRALQVAKMRKTPAQQAPSAAPQQAPLPRREDMPVDPTRSKSAQERQKFQEGGTAAPHGVIDLGNKIILGAPHGEPIELSEGLKQRVKELAAEHGAWYEGDSKDVGPNQELLGGKKAYRGSWDDAVAQNVKGYPTEYLAPMFSNVDVNRQHEIFEDPRRTIFDSIWSNQKKARYFKDRPYDKDTLANFLKEGSEKDADLMRMAASPATKENLQKFFSTGERLMWPENWQEYPNKLSKIAKRFEDSRNKYLRDAGPGVYVTGAGHIPELRSTFKNLNVIGGERSGYASGGDVWDKPRPKNLGKPEHLSKKEKSSAKAAAKAAGRPYPNLIDNMRAAREDGGTVERPTKMNKKVKHALDVALSETHPKRFHHTLARTGYADGGLPDMNISPPDLANEVPYTHEKALASQFDVAKSAPYKPKSLKLGITKIAPPKKVGLRAPRSDIGKMRLRKNISVKPKKFKLASGGHPDIDDALRLASRTMSDMAKHIGDEGVHGASMQQGSTSTIVKEKVPGKKAEVVYEHHAKTPTEEQVFASGGGAWTRAEGKDPEGGLNAKGRASAKAEGMNLKPPAPHPKNDKDAARRSSFCSRMSGMKAKLTSAKTANDPDSRINKSLRAWNCRADGGRLMHQDILDALNLAQRRRHFAVGGAGSPNAMYVGPSPEESNRQYLDYLYQNELGRAADEGGRDYWLQQLNNGMSMDQVQQMFDQSQEGQTFNQRPQQPPPFSNDPRYPHMPGIPGQKPNPPFPVDENPRYGWEPWLGGGGNNPFPPGTTPDVLNPRNDPYAGSTPFPGGGNGTKAGGQGIGGQGPMPQRTPLEEIDLMYRSQLGREADEGGRNYWLQQLQGGMSPDQIQQTFRNSQEGQDYQKRMLPMIDGPFGVGGGNGTKAGGGGGMPYPGGLGGQGQGPNPNPYGGLGNGTKAGGGGGYTGPIY